MALDLLSGSEVLITMCTFRQGHGNLYGGAISITVIPVNNYYLRWQSKNIFVKIMRTIFQDNHAIRNGGAVSMEGAKEVTTSISMINCIFLNNSARLYGGAIQLKLSSGIDYIMERIANYQNIMIENTTLSDNSAMQGAGVHIDC